MNIQEYMLDLGRNARSASAALAVADTGAKNKALLEIARALEAGRTELMQANEKDLSQGRENSLDDALLDRLELNNARIESMIEGLNQVAALPDPCGEITELKYRPSGIQVGKMRVPLGVVGIIYESRPNVTVDAASLCLKSGNAAILRGGSEAWNSNMAIAEAISKGLENANLHKHCVQVLETTDRSAVDALVTMDDYVDVIVPRGGKGLIERISRSSTVNVIKHLDGICHVYIDDEAIQEKALAIAVNSKTHRYGVCNAMETLLIHKNLLDENTTGGFLSSLLQEYREKGVELRACAELRSHFPGINQASDEDWQTEYLAPVLAIKLVKNLDDAIEHINRFGSQHTDAIVTENITKARQFMARVDSSSVIVNASTRFADGFEYGLGAEIGISTDKIHARGPVGLEGLTSQKWVVFGDGHVRS